MWQLKSKRVNLTSDEKQGLDALVSELMGAAHHIDVRIVLPRVAVYAQQIPRRLRQILYDFKLCQEHHIICFQLGSIDDEVIGTTPFKHRNAGVIELVSRYDLIHLMFSSLLGEFFGWSTIQNGYLFNDVMPVREHQDLVASSGFASPFGLHTEDAFHPWAGDYLGLLCLRNPNCVSTLFSGFDFTDLSPAALRTLFEPRFIVGVNIAHSVEKVKHVSPLLYGSLNAPYFRVNLNATIAQPNDATAEEALQEIISLLEQNVTNVVFEPGEFWYVDNLRVAHGREKFQPFLNGRDRWLRRLYISSAFRYTRGLRDKPTDRILDPSAQTWNTYL